MDCKQCETKLESYLDGEITLSDRRDFEEHINDCTLCKNKLESLRSVQNLVQKITYTNIPAALKKNIQNQLRDYTGEESKKTNLLHWLGFGGAMATGSLATWVFMTFVLISPLQTQLSDEIISAHVRSLMFDHATDVKSDDRHTVKPWFNGRVDFAPPVKDLKDAGFELLGGRLDYIQNKAISALVYQRRSHTINTFILKNNDGEETTAPQLIERQGYNLLFWKNKGLDYWVISDLNKEELKEFAQLTSKS